MLSGRLSPRGVAYHFGAAPLISLHRNTDNFGDESRYWRDFEPVDFSGELDRMATAISRFAWSPIQWSAGGRRKEEFFGRACYCVLDYDDGLTSLEQAKRMFEDCVHIIGTTRSHQRPKDDSPPCDRFRVVLKFERPIETVHEFKANMRYWIGRFGSDTQCVDAARFYWRCESVVSMSSIGETMEVIDPPPPPPPQDFSAYREAKVIPPWARGVLLCGAPRGRRNTTCFKLGLYLAQCGFEGGEIIDLIRRSPISLTTDEIARAVSNGVKAGKQIMAEQTQHG